MSSLSTAAFGRPDIVQDLRRDLVLVETVKRLNEIGLISESHESVMGEVAVALAPALAVGKVGVAAWSTEGEYLQLLPGSFGAGRELVASSQIDAVDPGSQAARVMTTGKGWYSNEAGRHLPKFAPWVRGFEIAQLMEVPLAVNGRRLGVLHLANRPAGFSEDELGLAQRIAPFVASAVEQVQCRIDLAQRTHLATIVGDAAAAVAAGHPLQQLITGPLADFKLAAECAALVVTINGEAAPRVVLRDPSVADALLDGLVGEARSGRQAPELQLRRAKGPGDPGAAMTHVPVLVAGQQQGSLSLLRVPLRPFTTADQSAVRRLANVIALAWATESYQLERLRRARLDERQRIADDLHDHVAQLLFTADLRLESLLEELEPTGLPHAHALSVRELVVRSEVALRESIEQLSVAEQATFGTRLSDLVEATQLEFEVPIRLILSAQDAATAERLPPDAAALLLRAAREAMVNASKHAGPCRIVVMIRPKGNRLTLTVTDDGIGVRTGAKQGHGLAALRRALRLHGATLMLSSAASGATTFRVTFPLMPR